MRPRSKANNLTVLVEFSLEFTINNGFQLFIDVLFYFVSSKDLRD